MAIRKGARAAEAAADAEAQVTKPFNEDDSPEIDLAADFSTKGGLGTFVEYASSADDGKIKTALVVGTPASITGRSRIPVLQHEGERHLTVFIQLEGDGEEDEGQRDLCVWSSTSGTARAYTKHNIAYDAEGAPGTWRELR